MMKRLIKIIANEKIKIKKGNIVSLYVFMSFSTFCGFIFVRIDQSSRYFNMVLGNTALIYLLKIVVVGTVFSYIYTSKILRVKITDIGI